MPYAERCLCHLAKLAIRHSSRYRHSHRWLLPQSLSPARFPLNLLQLRGIFSTIALASLAIQGSITWLAGAFAIVGLAHNLRLDVVAECVETAEYLEFLKTF